MFKNLLVIIDNIIKGRDIIIPEELQKQALEKLHSNQRGIWKNKATGTWIYLLNKDKFWCC